MNRHQKTHTDYIPYQQRPLDEETKHALYRLNYNIHTTRKNPDDFKKSIMVMLPKKRISKKCEEYQIKILTKITLGRIEKKIAENLSEDQFDF